MTVVRVGHEPPVFAIENPFRLCRKRKVIFPVKSTRTLGDSCIQSVHWWDPSQHLKSLVSALRAARTVISASDHHDTVIPFQTIYLV